MKADLYSLGIMLLESACPVLVEDQNAWNLVGTLGDKLREPEEVDAFLQNELGLDLRKDKQFFAILRMVLCAGEALG